MLRPTKQQRRQPGRQIKQLGAGGRSPRCLIRDAGSLGMCSSVSWGAAWQALVGGRGGKGAGGGAGAFLHCGYPVSVLLYLMGF